VSKTRTDPNSYWRRIALRLPAGEPAWSTFVSELDMAVGAIRESKSPEPAMRVLRMLQAMYAWRWKNRRAANDVLGLLDLIYLTLCEPLGIHPATFRNTLEHKLDDVDDVIRGAGELVEVERSLHGVSSAFGIPECSDVS
jgi:hypothetical protein